MQLNIPATLKGWIAIVVGLVLWFYVVINYIIPYTAVWTEIQLVDYILLHVVKSLVAAGLVLLIFYLVNLTTARPISSFGFKKKSYQNIN